MRIFITGIAGSGKTSTLAEIQKHGYVVIDLDATGICRWKHKETGTDTEYGPTGRDYVWLTQHGWFCDVEKLQNLLSCIREDRTIFVGGVAENIDEVILLFDKVFVLNVPEYILKERLTSRTTNHFGRKEDEQQFVIEENKKLLEKLRENEIIDGNQTIQETVEYILDNM
jgi:broad-specificity NMP kinase